MRVTPLFSGVFSIVRHKNQERNQRILKTALKQGEKYGFKIADDSNAKQIRLATISRNNDRLLKDAFTKSGIQFQYSKQVPTGGRPLKPLSLGEKLSIFFSSPKTLHSGK